MEKLSSKKYSRIRRIFFWLCFLIIVINISNLFHGRNMNIPKINQQAMISSYQVDHPVSTGIYSALSLGFWPKHYGNDWQYSHTAAGMTLMMYQYVYKINYGIYRTFRGTCLILISLLALYLNFFFASSQRKAVLLATVSAVFLIVQCTGCCCICQQPAIKKATCHEEQPAWTYRQPAEMRVLPIDHQSDIATIQSTKETIIDPAPEKPLRHLDTSKVHWKKELVKIEEIKVPKNTATAKQQQPSSLPVQVKTAATDKVTFVSHKQIDERPTTVYREITLQYEMIVYDGQEKELPKGSVEKLHDLAGNCQQITSTTKNLVLRIIGHASGEHSRRLAGLRLQVVRTIIEQKLPDNLKHNIEMINLDNAMPVYRADGKKYDDCVEIVVLTRIKPKAVK